MPNYMIIYNYYIHHMDYNYHHHIIHHLQQFNLHILIYKVNIFHHHNSLVNININYMIMLYGNLNYKLYNLFKHFHNKFHNIYYKINKYQRIKIKMAYINKHHQKTNKMYYLHMMYILLHYYMYYIQINYMFHNYIQKFVY